jgi:alkylation response protein AidB-like acyl-CoA dehydrogenase
VRFETRRETFAELERALQLAPGIRAAQCEIEKQQALPADLAARLASDGMFRLILPVSFGGSGLSLPQFVRVVEVIAEADGSTGWCVAQAAVFASVADLLHPETAAEIWGENRDAVVATGVPFGAEARAVDGGYLLDGRWRFASGCNHADWFAPMAPVGDVGVGGERSRSFLVPRADVLLGDGWNVRGMRGTGSREYRLDALFVPSERSVGGTAFASHLGESTGLHVMLLFACGFAAVGLGVARRAVNEFIELAAGKTPVFANRKLAEDDLVQTGLAEAEALLGATRAFLLDAAEECEHRYAITGNVDFELRSRMRLAATHAMRRSADVVDRVYAMAGTDCIFDEHPLQRCFQDIHALTQQVQGRASHFRSVGRVLLGRQKETFAF